MNSIKDTNHSTPLPHREGVGKSHIIAIVAGGDTSEYQVSLRSAQGIYSFIDKEKYTLYIVVMHGQDWHVQLTDGAELPIDRNDFSFMLDGQKVKFDFAYITIHGTGRCFSLGLFKYVTACFAVINLLNISASAFGLGMFWCYTIIFFKLSNLVVFCVFMVTSKTTNCTIVIIGILVI